MPEFNRFAAVLIKDEATYGVDSIPTGVANAVLCLNDVKIVPLESDRVNRNLVQFYHGQSQQLTVGERVKVMFSVEMASAGAAGSALPFGSALKGCGMSQTLNAGVDATYALISSGQVSQVIYFNRGGRRHILLGARGNLKASIASGGIPKWMFEYTGLYGGISDTAIPAQTLTGFQTPLPVSNANTPTVTVDGFASKLYSIDWDLKNKITYRNIPGDQSIYFTDRAPDGTLKIEAPTQAQKDFYAGIRAGSIVTTQVIHGVGAGKINQNNFKMQLLDVSEEEVDGLVVYSFPFTLVPTLAGNDEWNYKAL
jgi:hypothetical protein